MVHYRQFLIPSEWFFAAGVYFRLSAQAVAGSGFTDSGRAFCMYFRLPAQAVPGCIERQMICSQA